MAGGPPLKASQAPNPSVAHPLPPSHFARAGDGRSLGNLQKDQKRNQSPPWSSFPLSGAQEPTSAERPPPCDPPSLGRFSRPSPKKGAPSASAEHTGPMNPQPKVQHLEARKDAPQPVGQLLQTQRTETLSGLVSPAATQRVQAGDQEFRECCTRLRTCPAITPPSE